MRDYASDRLIRRKVVLHLLPTLGIMASIPVGQITDSLFVAFRRGRDALAAMNPACPFQLLAVSVFFFFGGGGSAEYAAALSAGDEDRAALAFRTMLRGRSA